MQSISIGDTLFALAEWLRTTRIVEFALWLQQQKLSSAIDTHFWVIPILQTIHILALAAGFGSVLLMNFRILGLASNGRTMSQTVRRYLPWVWWSLPVLFVTGLGMVIGEPPRELVNPIFWIKIALVIVVILVSLWFQASVHRKMATWETSHGGRVAIRLGAIGVILLWCLTMFAAAGSPTHRHERMEKRAGQGPAAAGATANERDCHDARRRAFSGG